MLLRKISCLAFVTSLFIGAVAFAQETANIAEKETTKIQMDAKYKSILEDIKKEALHDDQNYMTSHKEKAIATEVTTPTPRIPKRTQDKFVRAYILPFTNQNGVYQESIQIFKYRDGEFITVVDDESKSKSKDVDSNYSFESAK
jgi:hypothetical protein